MLSSLRARQRCCYKHLLHNLNSQRRFLSCRALQETVDQARDLCSNFRYGRLSDAESARQLLDEITRCHQNQPQAINVAVDLVQRLAPGDPRVFNPILTCWKNLMLSSQKRNHIQRSLLSLDTLMTKWDPILPGDAVTTAILVQVMLKKKPIAETQDYVETKAKEQNSQIYNQILKAHVDQKAPFTQLQKVLDTMQARGIPKDSYTYSILMHYWKDDLPRVQAILEDAPEVDETCWTQYVQYRTYGNFDESLDTVEKIVLERIVGIDPYQAGVASFAILENYRRRLVKQPNDVSTVEQGERFWKQVRHQLAGKARSKPHSSLEQPPSQRLTANLTCIMMEMYLKVRQYDKLERAFAELKNPNETAYTILIKSYGQQGRPEEATRALRNLLEETSYRVEPDVSTFNATLNAWLHTENSSADAFIVWDWIKDHPKCEILGVKPDSYTFALLMRLHIRNGRSAEKLLKSMVEDYELEPNNGVLSLTLQSMFVNEENLNFAVAEDLVEQIGRLNVAKFKTIVQHYPITLDAARTAIREFESNSSELTAHSFNLVLAILTRVRSHDQGVINDAWHLYHGHSSDNMVDTIGWEMLLELMADSPKRSSLLQAHRQKHVEDHVQDAMPLVSER